MRGVAVGAGADAWESDATQIVLRSDVQRVPVTAGQQIGFVVASSSPNRADGVDHKPGRKVVARCDLCLSGWASAQACALQQQRGSGCPVDGTVHPATAQQGIVGGVDDRITIEFGDVTQDRANFNHNQ